MGSEYSSLDRLVRFFLEQKLVVALLLLLMVGWGMSVAPFDWDIDWLPRDPVPVDAIPNLGENQQIVFTDWPGRSPQDVEDQVTYPLTVSLLGVPGVHEVRSVSMFGVSMIFLIFDEDIEFYWSRARILEKLNSLPAGTLPTDASPALGPDATALGQIYWYTLEGRGPAGEPVGGWDLHELRSVQDWYVRYGLLSAEGISEVASIGGYVQEYQIDLDPDAMRAYDVTLEQIIKAVRESNLDVGARVTEINRVEYIVRGVGFIEQLADLEQVSLRTGEEHIPVQLRDVATINLGPAQRRGALTSNGAEAVGGVVVVRENYNPLEAIQNVKTQIEEITPGLPAKAVIDWTQTTPDTVAQFAHQHGFEMYESPDMPVLNQDAWLAYLRDTPADEWPSWLTKSQLEIVPFYDRTGLIYETLGTLSDALLQQILVTVIVVMLMVLHLRLAMVISMMLPFAVLVGFILMKLARVDANVVALAGIAIAIGTIVDMGVIVTENVLRHLREAKPEEDRMEVVFRGTREVSSAILTAISTTIVSFLPVFTMTGAEGKMFIPLAYTKTFVLLGAILIALMVVPAATHLFVAGRARPFAAVVRRGALFVTGIFAIALIVLANVRGWPWIGPLGFLLFAVVLYHLLETDLPSLVDWMRPKWSTGAQRVARWLQWVGRSLAILVAVVIVGLVLADIWEPLGPERGSVRNAIFVFGLIGGLIGLFWGFMFCYGFLLRCFLMFKALFLLLPALLVVWGLCIWLGFDVVMPMAGPVWVLLLLVAAAYDVYQNLRLLGGWRTRSAMLVVGVPLLVLLSIAGGLGLLAWRNAESVRMSDGWVWARHAMPGLGREFMPPLDEGMFLWMPTTMPHASMGEVLEVLKYQDMAIASVPEVKHVAGKLGRAETALDPAPLSMIESVIEYKSEYITDDAGRRMNFKYDPEADAFVRDEDGELIPDAQGRPYRQWREHIQSPRDIWDEIVEAAAMPGTTSAPRLQPIETRLVMLQTGMRAPMGLKVRAPDLETLDQMAVQLERLLREVPAIQSETVNADRVTGKPYLEIDIDREAIARYGINIVNVQQTISAAIGGMTLTDTVEGRERYPVRVRYQRELRDDIESMQRVLVSSADGTQIPLGELAKVQYTRGPQMIRSEDTFLTAYVTFGGQGDMAEVEVVEQARDYLQSKVASGELVVPAGVSWRFAGNYEHQQRAAATLRVVLPVSLAIIFLILYFQFRSVMTTGIVFSGIAVAWAGGFILLYLYSTSWFGNFYVFGVNMRDLFQIQPMNLSVAVWVGFLALFGIAVDDGVVMATYLKQSFEKHMPKTVAELRQATVAAGLRRVRPCLMTSATTLLALLPVLTSTGRGAEIMIPMAIPSVGGMMFVLLSMFTVPVLYCLVQELRGGFDRAS